MRRLISFATLILIFGLFAVAVFAGGAKAARAIGREDRILVCAQVVEALGKLGGQKAESVLSTAAKSKEYFIRAYAVQAIGKLKTKQSIPLLEGLSRDRNELVRVSAIVSLVGLGRNDKEAVLIQLLKNANQALRASMIQQMGELGGKNLSILNNLLSSEKDDFIRVKLIEQLGKRAFAPALGYIRLALRDQNPRVRRAACYALGELKDSQSREIILGMLDDKDILIRLTAKVALGKMGDASRLKQFYQGVKSEDEMCKSASYDALANLGELDIVPQLLNVVIIPETSTILRKQAANSLMLLKPKILTLIKGNIKRIRELRNIAISDKLDFVYQVNGRPLVSIFTEALKDAYNPLHNDAPIILEAIADEAAKAGLREALLGRDANLIAAAAYALGQLKDKQAVDWLVKAFERYKI